MSEGPGTAATKDQQGLYELYGLHKSVHFFSVRLLYGAPAHVPLPIWAPVLSHHRVTESHALASAR